MKKKVVMSEGKFELIRERVKMFYDDCEMYKNSILYAETSELRNIYVGMLISENDLFFRLMKKLELLEIDEKQK